MNWTTDKPTEPGWYWVRAIKGEHNVKARPHIRKFSVRQGRADAEAYLQPVGGRLSITGYTHFAGPIEEPL